MQHGSTELKEAENQFFQRVEHTTAGNSIVQQLAEAGYKNTESRRAIIELILRRQGHFSAADIYEDVRREAPKVGRATVFRTLDLLAGQGLLEKVHLGEGCHSYVVCQSRHHHHLICSSCGTAVDFDECNLNELLQKLAQETRFRIKGHWLEIFGECETCQSLGKVSSSALI